MPDKNLVLDYYKNLKFDNIKMDTTLAEVYLDKHNKSFKSIIEEDNDISTSTTVDNANNTIVCIAYTTDYIMDYNPEMFKKIILQNVSEVIRRNAELFAQLEFMIRGIPQRDVKKYDVNIIADQFEFASKSVSCEGYFIRKSDSFGDVPFIYMMEDMPLCTLAKVAMTWTQFSTVRVVATQNTAAVCTLFAELCIEAGVPKNNLFVEILSKLKNDSDVKSTIKNSSSVAVFTEHGDIESGVDIVFNVTTEPVYPWRLRRIIVQENTYERFKRTILSKVGSLNVKKLPIEEIVNTPGLVDLYTYVPDLLEKSKDVLHYRNKLLAFDYADHLEGDAAHTRIVLVHTYRTTKELLCLMRRYEPRYLSLWCDQISTANEIVFDLNVPNVWLNDFGLFSGPGGVAETFLKCQDNDQIEVKNVPEEALKSLIKWNTFSLNERKSALENALKTIYDTGNIYDTENIYVSLLPEDKDLVINYVRTWNYTSSLTVRDGVICQQVKLPVGIIVYEKYAHEFLDIINTLLIGNILYFYDEVRFTEAIYNIFSSYDVPIACNIPRFINDIYYCHRFYRIGNNRIIISSDLYVFLTKTIWSSFGETFAN